MNDKELNNPPSAIPERSETQWVMVFNLITGKGRDEIKKTYKVNKKRLVIGSALSSDIRIQQNAVSNVHAVVEMDEQGQAHIYDMASETGVFVNDKKVLSEALKDGDEVKIGFGTLTYKRTQVQDSAVPSMPAQMAMKSPARKLYYDAQEDYRPLILEDERNVIQIFEYPAANEQALQVVMYWGEVILDVRHITDHDPVILGETKKATFCVPGMTSDFPLVTFEGGVTLQVNQEMTGVVRSGRSVTALADLGATRITLKQSDQAKIQFRDITFFLSYSPVPPHLRRQRVIERDPVYTRIWFSSLALTIALILLLVGIQPEKKLETEELPPRVAAIIFKPIPPPPPPPVEKPKPQPEPEKKVEPPKPKPEPPKPKPKPTPPPKELPKQVKPAPVPPKQVTKPQEKPIVNTTKGSPAPANKPAGGNEGAGAKAAGDEGKRGKPNAPKAPVPMNRGAGSPSQNTAAKSPVQGKGNVEALFSDITGSISKNMAAGSAGNAGSNLRAHSAFDTEGNGGGGLVGSGSGGGGTSTTSQGLSNSGKGDGLRGSGMGAIGRGGNLSGTGNGPGRPNVEVGNGADTIIMGGLDKSVIDEIVKRHMPQISYCYKKELNGATGLQGRVLARWVISGSGRVSQAGVESTSLGNANVERCLVGVIKSMIFPEPLGGGIVEVSYPFSFTPSVGK